ncbi:MAG: HAMP domain-containing histidine kinase, partial [Rhodospirillales bacterium]|nr:HAMP domain-containing histidine kinase [Rhodospirillales bacterium]
ELDQGVLLVDAGGHITAFLGPCAALLGVSEDALAPGAPLPAPLASLNISCRAVLGEVQVTVLSLPDGGRHVALTGLEPLYHAQAIAREASGRLLEAEKMAGLGALVAGVAHDMNTPIGITLTAATHLLEKTNQLRETFEAGAMKKSDFQHYIDMAAGATQIMASNIHRAVELIQSFKQVAVDQASAARRGFKVGATIQEILRSLQPRLRKLPHKVEVRCPAEIEMDSYPGPFGQVLTNLIMNSVNHGFDDGRAGRMTITVEVADEDSVALEYRDDGRGIPPEHLERIFEAFFTTKRGKGGSGLGLHLVHSIVTGPLGGRVEVASAPGEGTVFSLTLPRVAPEAAPGA